MKQSIKVLARTKKGVSEITVFNPKNFLEMLKEIEGEVALIVKPLGNDISKNQHWYIRNELAPSIIRLVHDQGQNIDLYQAFFLMLHEASNFQECAASEALLNFLSEEEYDESFETTYSIDSIINNTKIWINSFFNVDLF